MLAARSSAASDQSNDGSLDLQPVKDQDDLIFVMV